MSVTLNPSNSLGFKRPLTQLVKRTLTITNHNSLPIAFKVKTTAPKLYCVRPNSGRVEPGESLDVSVMLQPLKEEPPLNAKCKDKFLIQSTLITPAKETMNSADIWSNTDASEDGKIAQHKLRVTFLPAEGQALEEEDESQAHPYDGSRQNLTNGHAQRILDSIELPPRSQEVHRALTPPVDFSVAREDSRELAHDVPLVHVSSAIDPLPERSVLPTEHPAADSDLEYAPDPAPIPIPAPVPAAESAVSPESIPILIPIQEPVPVRAPAPGPASIQDSYNEELVAKYELALHEIERLRTIVAKHEESAVSEIRRRRPVLSDDGMSVTETDVQTAFADESQYPQQEGVPLQVVVIIALGVFITTYLFF